MVRLRGGGGSIHQCRCRTLLSTAMQKKEKKVKITLWGGFHNAPAVNVLIPEYAYENLCLGIETLQDVLSDAQRARMDRHFCGIKGCTCMSYHRALWGKA